MNNNEPVKEVKDIDEMPERDNERLTTADMAGASAALTRARTDDQKNQMNRGSVGESEEGFEPLFDGGEAERFRSRWYQIQGRYGLFTRRYPARRCRLLAAESHRLAPALWPFFGRGAS